MQSGLEDGRVEPFHYVLQSVDRRTMQRSQGKLADPILIAAYWNRTRFCG